MYTYLTFHSPPSTSSVTIPSQQTLSPAKSQLKNNSSIPMTNPTRQPYSNSPHPSTFLWAHELRRENIQLVNQIDGLRAELAAANDTIASLNRNLENLELRAREENARLENSLKGLEARFDTNLQSGIERVEDLQAENRQ